MQIGKPFLKKENETPKAGITVQNNTLKLA